MSNAVSDILKGMADTFDERNGQYRDGYLMFGPVMAALYPNGVVLKTADDFTRFHLLMLKIIKLIRLVNSGLTHEDSVHDDAIYSAMLESIMDDFSVPLQAAENDDE